MITSRNKIAINIGDLFVFLAFDRKVGNDSLHPDIHTYMYGHQNNFYLSRVALSELPIPFQVDTIVYICSEVFIVNCSKTSFGVQC